MWPISNRTARTCRTETGHFYLLLFVPNFKKQLNGLLFNSLLETSQKGDDVFRVCSRFTDFIHAPSEFSQW
jgi:hypothetical protein